MTLQSPEAELRRLYDEHQRVAETAFRYKANESPVTHVEAVACEVRISGLSQGSKRTELQVKEETAMDERADSRRPSQRVRVCIARVYQ